MPDFNGDGTGYSSRATAAVWELVYERFLEWYEKQGVPETWDEFCDGNSLRGTVGSNAFDVSLQRQLEFELTMPDELWMLIVDLTNWSEIVDTLVAEFNLITDKMPEEEEDEDDAE